MAQKIIKIGSSLGVTVSKQLLSSVGLKYGDEVRLFTDEKTGHIVLEPIKNQERLNTLLELKNLMQQNSETLDKISDE